MNIQELAISPQAMLYMSALFFVSLILFFHDMITEKSGWKGIAPQSQSRWSDLFLMLWIVIVIIFIAQIGWEWIVGDQDLGVWTEVGPGLLVQLLTLIFIIISCLFFRKLFGREINNGRSLSPTVFGKGVYYFFAGLPLVWLTGALWTFLLNYIERWGFKVELDQQELVSLFAKSESDFFVATMFIFAIVIAPIVEEFIFRVGVYRFLKEKWGPFWGMSISALFFALVHANLMAFLPLFLLGMLLVRAYEKTGRITTSIVFHGLFNCNTLIMLVLEPNLSLIQK